MKKETLSGAADRLTCETQRKVTIKCVRNLKRKGVDVSDPEAVEKSFRNSERPPKKLHQANEPEPESLGSLDVEYVAERERKLLVHLIDFAADADGDSKQMIKNLMLAAYMTYSHGYGELLGDSHLLAAEIRKISARLKR